MTLQRGYKASTTRDTATFYQHANRSNVNLTIPSDCQTYHSGEMQGVHFKAAKWIKYTVFYCYL